MSKEQQIWSKHLGSLQNRITRLEDRVLSDLEPPRIQERVLPFVESTRMSFDVGDMSAKDVPLVQSANRITFLTQLTYRVLVRLAAGGIATIDNELVMLPSPAGMTLSEGLTAVFDFEWNFSLEKTQRSYANGRIVDSEKYLARDSMGMITNENTLLFSPRNPLKMTTNEFFIPKIRPIFSVENLGPGLFDGFIVELTAAGYRKFSAE